MKGGASSAAPSETQPEASFAGGRVPTTPAARRGCVGGAERKSTTCESRRRAGTATAAGTAVGGEETARAPRRGSTRDVRSAVVVSPAVMTSTPEANVSSSLRGGEAPLAEGRRENGGGSCGAAGVLAGPQEMTWGESPSHVDIHRGDEFCHKSKVDVAGSLHLCDAVTPPVSSWGLRRYLRQRDASAPIAQRAYSPFLKNDESFLAPVDRVCVGPAVGNSGQKPFIRHMTRRDVFCCVMPPLTPRSLRDDLSFGRSHSAVNCAGGTRSDVGNTSPRGRCAAGLLPLTFASEEKNKPAAKHGPSQRLHPQQLKSSPAPLPPSSLSSQRQQLKKSVFLRSHTVPGPLSTVRPTSVAAPFPPPLLRPISPLCLAVLRERDRRLERQKVTQEAFATEVTRKEASALSSEMQPPPRGTFSSGARDVSPRRCSFEGAGAKEHMGSSAAAPGCAENASEERGVARLCGASLLLGQASSFVRNSHHRDGVVRRFSASERLAPARGRREQAMASVPLASSDKSGVMGGDNVGEEEREDDDAGDSEWDAEEDPWWCFCFFWCGAFERPPPPPPFVPPLDLSSVHIPDNIADQMAYVIPAPTPTTAFAGVFLAVAGDELGACAQLAANMFDAAGEIGGGAGMTARKMRVRVLLLETHERRSRRRVLQEEAAARREMSAGSGSRRTRDRWDSDVQLCKLVAYAM